MNIRTPASTTVILVRPLAEKDTDALFDTVSASMSTLSQWLPWATPSYSRADAETWIAHCRRARETEDEYHFGIFDADWGDLFGGIVLDHRIRAYHGVHVGCWVADALGGRGTRAAIVITAGLSATLDARGDSLSLAMLQAARRHLLRIDARRAV